MRYVCRSFFILLWAFCLNIQAQAPFRAMFYNVENLFDCQHDTLKDDKEFLADSQRRWTKTRYWKKLNALTKVVAAVAEEQLPDLIGVCEVENDTVLRDWTRRSAMRALGYRYVMTESPDLRGIDVGLLYQPGSFKVLEHREIKVNLSEQTSRPTRNVLYVKGRLRDNDTLHVLVCHLPSRLGKRRESEYRRKVAAQVVRQVVDSVRVSQPMARMLVMGDFNAEMGDEIFEKEILSVVSTSENGNFPHESLPLFYVPMMTCKENKEVKGTYRYRGIWESIDHIFVSPSLSERVVGDNQIIAFPFMCETEQKYGGIRPFRTYQGPIYKGVYSDHFPIVVDFEFDE